MGGIGGDESAERERGRTTVAMFEVITRASDVLQ
jgi:hypothetical protein